MIDENDLLKARLLSKEIILETVDEYVLYCFYLGFEPDLRVPYISPIRDKEDPDTRASFSLFMNDYGPCEYRWKDSGKGLSGDVFALIKHITGANTLTEVYGIVRRQCEIGFGAGQRYEGDRIVYYKKPEARDASVIKIKSKPFTEEGLKFWLDFGITKKTLDLYNVTQLKCLWFREDQPNGIYPKGLSFAYRIADRYKIYQPFFKEYKFCNNFTEMYVEGLLQLKYESDTLVITKSLKDVMFLHELGYEAISPRSENILLPKKLLEYLATRYKRIIILFDNDMKHKGDEYPYPKVYVPEESCTKDITDYRKMYGHEKAKELLKQLIYES
jgi:hypothetical protein